MHAWTIRRVDIAAINADPERMADPERVERFAACRLYERVPVALYERNGRYLLQDGLHRIESARRNGEQDILASIESVGA